MPSVFHLAAWALISLSLFNGFALLWLGLTMFLAAEVRQSGLWLVLLGISMAGLFFLSHSLLLLDQLTPVQGIWLEGWWKLGWIPVILAPLLWYLTILWYAGLEESNTALGWHKIPRLVLFAIAIILLFLHAFAYALPTFAQITFLDFSNTLNWGGIPLLLLLFPPYALLCVTLPLHALRHPAAPRRLMADIARDRARPWLMISASLLLLVALLVALFIIIAILPLQVVARVHETSIFILPMLLLDLAITAMIAVAIIILGKAVVSYEIFTGKTLPRGGFARQWANAVYFSGLSAAFIAYSLVFSSHLIYSLIAGAGLSMAAFALLTWQSFAARDETIASLRPFVSGQFLMDDIIGSDAEAFSHAQTMFTAICQDFLNTHQAQISPMNTLLALVPNPLLYPPERTVFAYDAPIPSKIQQMLPELAAGFRWILPLWSARGLIGLLFLGDKRDGLLYTEEEIQVAQAAAERILDTLAGEQIARNLMGIQRRRMLEQQVMDFQTRRSLHDDSLPRIHAAILSLSTLKAPAAEEAIQSLTAVHQDLSRLIRNQAKRSEQSDGDFFSRTESAINAEFSTEFTEIIWQWPERQPSLDTLSADLLFAALREIVRNAAVHGRGANPQRPLRLSIQSSYTDKLKICINDDGVGLANSQYRGGAGSGLTLHSTLLALLGGTIALQAGENGGTTVTVLL